jgi:hypothetical protein
MLQAASPSPDFERLQKRLGIPSSIAKVVDANIDASRGAYPEYVLIEDIHRHPEAQANIAALLLHAHNRWNLSKTYIEGAYIGQTIRPAADNTPFRTQLKEGLISGAEMAAAMAPAGTLELSGLEDPDAYKSNVEAYQAALDAQSQALQEIETLRLLQKTLDFSARMLSDDQLDTLELLARLKLKPSEYAEYLRACTEHPSVPELTKSLEAADRFYQMVEYRSDIFVEHVLKDQQSSPKALVTGGFHTAKMAHLLQAAGKTFVVLTPNVTQSGFDDLYARGMNETISALKLR